MRIRFAPWHRGAVDEILRAWSLGGLVLLALVACADWAYGGWVKADKEVSVGIFDLTQVPLEVDADEFTYRVVGSCAKAFREYDPNPKNVSLQVLGREDGYAYIVVSGQKGGKLLPLEVIVVKVGKGAPNPQPDPQPGPGPKPEPAPSTKPVKFIVVVEETADGAGARGNFLLSKTIAERFKEKGIGHRVVDKDGRSANGLPPNDVRRFIDEAKGKPLPRLYLLDETGREIVTPQVMPAKVVDFLNLLEKYGG